MAILAVHRQRPNWPEDKNRPIYEINGLFVETDGPVPNQSQIDAVLHPLVLPQPTPLNKQQKLDRMLRAYGLTLQDLKDELNVSRI